MMKSLHFKASGRMGAHGLSGVGGRGNAAGTSVLETIRNLVNRGRVMTPSAAFEGRGDERAALWRVNWLYYVFAAAAGAMNTVQAGSNAQLRKSLDQPIAAGLAVYITGMLGLLVLLPFVRSAPWDWSRAGQAPWWAWMGGLLSIVSTMAGVLLARKLGSAGFTAATLTFSLLCSVLLDHFGWVGFELHRASPLRIVGCVLLVSGLFFITRY